MSPKKRAIAQPPSTIEIAQPLFRPMDFVEETYGLMIVRGADGQQAVEVAINLLLNVLLGVVELNPDTCKGDIQALAAGLRRGFQKLEDANDALRCREVLEYPRNFQVRPKP